MGRKFGNWDTEKPQIGGEKEKHSQKHRLSQFMLTVHI